MKHVAILMLCCLTSGLIIESSSQAKEQQAIENWSRFRGPTGQSVSVATDLPVEWDIDKNIAWKTAIPGQGWSSPIVWGDRIFLTTATDEGRECRVIAIDLKSGKILWNNMVFTQETKNKHGKNSYATSTPVTDGERVYAVFAGGAFVALDFDGNILWTNKELDYYSQHGLGTSPILYKDMLIMSVDPSDPVDKDVGWRVPWDKSYILALDTKTGRQRWKTMRGSSRVAHITPIIVQMDGKDQLISPTGNITHGLDPETGKILWSVETEGEGVVPSPSVAEGLLFTAWSPENRTLRAIRLGGKGDCTKTHIAWEQKRNSPQMASILYIKPCIYTGTDNGSFTAYEAATGEFLWQKRVGGPINPSPLFADGKIYVLDENGKTTVFKPSNASTEPAEVISENDLEEHALASIAVAGKQLLIRTDHHLWCIGK